MHPLIAVGDEPTNSASSQPSTITTDTSGPSQSSGSGPSSSSYGRDPNLPGPSTAVYASSSSSHVDPSQVASSSTAFATPVTPSTSRSSAKANKAAKSAAAAAKAATATTSDTPTSSRAASSSASGSELAKSKDDSNNADRSNDENMDSTPSKRPRVESVRPAVVALFNCDEINYLIYRYLMENGFAHTAYLFGNESNVMEAEIDANQVPRGALIKVLQKGMYFAEAELIALAKGETKEKFEQLSGTLSLIECAKAKPCMKQHDLTVDEADVSKRLQLMKARVSEHAKNLREVQKRQLAMIGKRRAPEIVNDPKTMTLIERNRQELRELRQREHEREKVTRAEDSEAKEEALLATSTMLTSNIETPIHTRPKPPPQVQQQRQQTPMQVSAPPPKKTSASVAPHTPQPSSSTSMPPPQSLMSVTPVAPPKPHDVHHLTAQARQSHQNSPARQTVPQNVQLQQQQQQQVQQQQQQQQHHQAQQQAAQQQQMQQQVAQQKQQQQQMQLLAAAAAGNPSQIHSQYLHLQNPIFYTQEALRRQQQQLREASATPAQQSQQPSASSAIGIAGHQSIQNMIGLTNSATPSNASTPAPPTFITNPQMFGGTPASMEALQALLNQQDGYQLFMQMQNKTKQPF
uniref:LisH domain-containing protein n=1 Tax=Panagrellus redivivus TaxID=6233 RepID=A0A7E4VFR4_PANRE